MSEIMWQAGQIWMPMKDKTKNPPSAMLDG